MINPRHICESPNICLKCKHAKELREWRLKNKDKAKQYQDKYNSKYYALNKEKIKLQTLQYFYSGDNQKHLNQKKRENRAKKRTYYNNKAKEWHWTHRDKHLKKMNEHYHNNNIEINKKQYQYKRKKYYSDEEYRLKEVISARIRQALLHNYKSASTMVLIGCSIPELRLHLEKQFTKGMSWKNHSITGWHIDHIVPCDSFDLTDPEQQRKCFHYSNLQPLWYDVNIRKGTTI
jgi:hypothetical protein